MQKWVQKLVLFIAIVTTIGHDVLPHHHEDIDAGFHTDNATANEIQSHSVFHFEDDQPEHELFSFAQIDEDFVPAKVALSRLELPLIFLFVSIVLNFCISLPAKTAFRYFREFPPPGSYLSDLPLRAPPAC
jgi:hypothetical protein